MLTSNTVNKTLLQTLNQASLGFSPEILDITHMVNIRLQSLEGAQDLHMYLWSKGLKIISPLVSFYFLLPHLNSSG